MYSYSTSLDYLLYHIPYWIPDHIHISLPHTAATYFSTTCRTYLMYSYSPSLGYPTIFRFLYHIQELLDVQLPDHIQHIAWLPDFHIH